MSTSKPSVVRETKAASARQKKLRSSAVSAKNVRRFRGVAMPYASHACIRAVNGIDTWQTSPGGAGILSTKNRR